VYSTIIILNGTSSSGRITILKAGIDELAFRRACGSLNRQLLLPGVLI
jgi:hypothetical protein